MGASFSLFPLLVTLFAITLFIKLLFKSKNGASKPHPPGPPGRPLVGNIFDLGEIPHQTLYKLRADYGPVIWLKLGAINTMVVQSAEAAAELFKKCDLQFSDRKTPDSLTALGYSQGSVAVGAYSDYWRKLRRICTTEFLVQKRVNESTHIRQKCVGEMIEWIKRDMAISQEIQLDRFLFVTAFNVVGNLMLSEDVMETRLGEASDFFDAFLMFLEWCGKPNVADFFPFLKWVDPQGIRKNTAKYLGKLIGFASEIVKERIERKGSGMEKERDDFLDALLDEGEVDENGPDKLSVKNITIALLVILFIIIIISHFIQ
ncbi:cytochrome p450 76a2 [Phtheirospermum japonicum]|uniref:Cytochrome p450 76a2 n=1 Tax=Phtheirospermum japonicum TaxID=374723 RepID=A0A830CBM9_9LAMI|nr:cytochrome p450 76a2 [Phtheirospermum japonicum]